MCLRFLLAYYVFPHWKPCAVMAVGLPWVPWALRFFKIFVGLLHVSTLKAVGLPWVPGRQFLGLAGCLRPGGQAGNWTTFVNKLTKHIRLRLWEKSWMSPSSGSKFIWPATAHQYLAFLPDIIHVVIISTICAGSMVIVQIIQKEQKFSFLASSHPGCMYWSCQQSNHWQYKISFLLRFDE